MDYPEVNIDSDLTQTFEEEKAWLRNYTEQLHSITEVPSLPQYQFENIQAKYLETALQMKNLIMRNHDLKHCIDKLELNIREKDLKFSQCLDEHVREKLWLKAKEKTLEEEIVKEKAEKNEMWGEICRLRKAAEEGKIEKIDSEKEELKTRVLLLTRELEKERGRIEGLLSEIFERTEKIQEVEREKAKALELFQMKEARIREEIESSYNVIEATQQAEFYCRKMKEYQNLYLSSKSHENITEEQLLKVLNENFALETTLDQSKQDYMKANDSYTSLRKDYDYLSVKLKATSDLYAKASETFNKEVKSAELLKRENQHLLAQVKALTEKNSYSIFTFTSVEDLIVKQAQMVKMIEENNEKIEKLEKELLAANRSLSVFANPKELKNEELLEKFPDFDEELRFSKDQLLEQLTIKNSRVSSEVVYLENKIKLMESNENNLKKYIETAKTHNKALQQKIRNYETFNIDQPDTSKLTEEFKILEEKLRISEKTIKASTERNKTLQSSLEILTNTLVELEKRNSSIHMENKKSNDSFLSEISDLNSQIFALQQQNSELQKKTNDMIGKENAKVEAFHIEMELQRKRNIDLSNRIEALERQNMITIASIEGSHGELRKQIEHEQQKRFLIEAELEETKLNLIGSLEKCVVLFHKSLSIKRPDIINS